MGEGRTLIMVHKHLRQELRQIRDAVDEVAAGRRPAEDARSLISHMTIRQNYWTLGGFCASYCRVLTLHHSLEDQVFPGLAGHEPALGPVIEKLSREHEVIADVITGLDTALTRLLSDETGFDDVRDQVALLDRLLTSHLDYEESQLVEPLGRLGY
ncbi:hemerythrin domain-containing protein [Actinocrispum wychmicini]|uniref:Hemerythrin HHE cation binding domain-containing protein n=1 Tax=Actinocrispum wychmicini TaxID=1213861 RepID=A0A4V2S4F5_9PSEU|nr:hemerythrin domain-containing protein [Actinocrispum wychmicini]TCO48060.1 hemerythrin HHE cation binding domain-containing protein [Actinocrispum wychmicini]